jgi:hypothetical protein
MAYSTDIERLNYYEGEYLGAVDFAAEQQYHRNMRQRHNLGQHTWGIISGLGLAVAPNGGTSGGFATADVYLQPGMAVDGFGREIVVLGQAALTETMFAAFYDPTAGANPVWISVWIGYQQALLQSSTDACASANVSGSYGRVEETYTLTATTSGSPPINDAIVVDGAQTAPPASSNTTPTTPLPDPPPVTLPFDDSVPFQEFSTDDSSLSWWILLGRVFWDPHNQIFLQSNADPVLAAAAINAGREYAGNVSAALYVPGGTYTIVDRDAPDQLPTVPTDPNYGGVRVKIAGSLQVDRLLNAETNVLIGGAYNASDPGLSPLTIVASGASEELIQFRNPAGQETWHICENVSGIPPGINFGEMVSGNPVDGRLFLQTGGKVGIGTLLPQQNLSVAGGVNLDQTNLNKGSFAPGLSFGSTSGEGIASNRTPGEANLYGLDFYTDNAINMSLTQVGKLGIGTTAPEAQLEVSGGQWNLSTTAGDLRIGDSSLCMKFGVALAGAGAGDGRIRAAGGTNRLMIGSGVNDTLTIVDDQVSTLGNLTVGGGISVLPKVPGTGALVINGNRTYMLGTDAANFHWIMAGGIQEPTATSGNNAIGMSYDSATGQGFIHIDANWSFVASGPKLGFVVDRCLSRDAAPLERGDVVVIHQGAAGEKYCGKSRIPLIEVERTGEANSLRVCGVIDEPKAHPDTLRDLNQSAIRGLSIATMVTLGAYSQCKVDADLSPIVAGDLLTTSTTPGHAQKLQADQPRSGVVIGKALASLANGKGMIPVLISHQ